MYHERVTIMEPRNKLFSLRYSAFWLFVYSLIICSPIIFSIFLAFFTSLEDGIKALAFLSAGLVSLFLLLKTMLVAIALTATATAISRVKSDREFFFSKSKTPTSQQIRGSLVRGRFKFEQPSANKSLSFVARRQRFSFGHDRCEETFLLLECDLLDKYEFSRLQGCAKVEAQRLPKRKRNFGSARCAQGITFCIIANRVLETSFLDEIDSITTDKGEAFTCVVDVSTGRVYFDGSRRGPVTHERVSQKLICKYVLGYPTGKVPRLGNKNYCKRKQAMLENLELLPVYELFAGIYKDEKETRLANKLMTKALRDGHFSITKNAIYYKERGKVLRVDIFDQKGFDIEIGQPISWYYPRKRQLSDDHKKCIQHKLESFLQEQGYTFSYYE